MSYNNKIENNNIDLQAILNIVKNLPEEGSGVELPDLTNEGSAADLLVGKELIDGDGNIVTGEIPTKTASNLTVSGATVTVPAGYYATQATKSVTSGYAKTPATTITKTPSITVNSSGLITASISGTQSVTPTVTAGYVSSGTAGTITVSGSATKQLTTQEAKTITPSTTSQTAVASGRYTTGTITVGAIPSSYVKPTSTKTATTYTPGASDQTIAAGTYCSGAQTIKGDANLIPSNIKNGESIFGVTGIADVNGVQLPELTDEGTAADLRSGKQLIDGSGNVIVGTMSSSNATTAKKDVNFYDYDGTLLYSYTVAEVQELAELPALPTQPGLICQGWNYDLETIKSYNRAVDIGATYITDDGKTRLYIKIAAEGRMTVPLYFSQTVSDGVIINWGDGSTTETLSGTSKVNTSHTYTSTGDYVISLAVTSGTLGLGHRSSSYCVMGSTGNTGQVYCNMLQKVEIGSGVTSIDYYTFQNCSSLASIVIPNSVTKINGGAFGYCRSLASIIIPNGVTSISVNTFDGCYSLASIIIPNSVTSIGRNAFNNCCSLASIVIADSIIIIDDSAFKYCYSLANIAIPDGITSIGHAAFYDCRSLINITIPDGITDIEGLTFYRCHSLASVVIPDSVTSIGDTAFEGCHSLASIVIPDGVTSIGSSMFLGCYSLASIIIPDSVTSIGQAAFKDCYGVAIYDFTNHTIVPTLSNANAFSNIPSDCVIKVPAALYDEWIAATNWSTYASQIVAV